VSGHHQRFFVSQSNGLSGVDGCQRGPQSHQAGRGSDDDIESKKADISLTMDKPIPARLAPQPSAMMTFQGTVSSYTPTPFMMSMTDGVLLDKSGNPLTPPAPVHHPAHKKSP